MTKRHEALVPLTHDHHHALVQARALVAAADADAAERSRVAESFLRFYRDDTLLHFREEEEVLFPKLLQHVQETPPELTRVLLEHVGIHAMVGRLRDSLRTGAPSGEQLRALGETLRAHVRVEENDLFPLIERVVPKDELKEIVLAARNRGSS